MVFLKYAKEKTHEKRRVVLMLNDKICKLREELNNSIITGQDYTVTYELSVRLDDLIAEYYKEELAKMQVPKQTKKNIRKKLICY